MNPEFRGFTLQQDDITLVIDNAIKYNKYDTQFYKVATRLRALSKLVLPKLNSVIVPPHLQGPAPSFQVDQEEVDPSAQYAEASDCLGDLEPPLQNIELLFSNEAIREHEEMEFLLGDQDPISALVAFDLGVPRQIEPSPPPSPSPSPSPSPLPPPPLTSLEAKKGKAKGKGKKGTKNYVVPMDVEQLAALDGTPGSRARAQQAQGGEGDGHVTEASTISISVEMGNEHSDIGPSTEPRRGNGKGKATAPTLISIPGLESSGLDHEPHLIETIDKQQSFKMFNEGWILPPDQKRGGRARVERPPPPVPKKKKPCAYYALFVRRFTDLSPSSWPTLDTEIPPARNGRITDPTSNRTSRTNRGRHGCRRGAPSPSPGPTISHTSRNCIRYRPPRAVYSGKRRQTRKSDCNHRRTGHARDPEGENQKGKSGKGAAGSGGGNPYNDHPRGIGLWGT